uniref:procollagen-proline 3-dioxygenase n=1 Tax=Chelydra serpentina TaxID=8475 RepID=A0A8C3T0E7_CHESE
MALAALLLLLLAPCAAEPPEPAEPPDALFAAGSEAYARGDWPAVILHMERALRARGALRSQLVRCRLRCANSSAWPAGEPGPPPALRDLLFFRQLLRRAACLRACAPGAPSRYLLSEELELEFRKRSPYNYLQVAYFKIHKIDKAVAAAHTFFVGNPDHVEMRQNLEYYQMMAGVKESDFTDLEAKPHMLEFRLGVKFYTEEQPGPAVLHLEKALEEYFVADAECRALCEGPYDYEGYNYLEYSADLVQAITDHYMQVLSCRQSCVTELASQPGRDKPIEDFLPSHFNYLQFAYYNSGNYEKAIECAKTYLLFFPNDEVMNQNLAYYTAVLGERLAAPIGPQEVSDLQSVPGNPLLELSQFAGLISAPLTPVLLLGPVGGPLLYDGLSVAMNSRLLNGSQRVVVDGVISEEECLELQKLTNAAASAGDGYRGKTSPHSPSETFYGVTVYKALKLGQEGKVPMPSARLYYNVTEKVRRVMESYFRLDTPLYFSYSHLVCRTAIEEKQADRTDSSHAVHVDNCILNAEAMVCVKEPPAYTFRDYSAILYLNGDFEGGAFYFTELDATTMTAEVQPQCGRAVGFSSGSENPHGVKAVTRGQRCAIALWFTLDPRHSERERVQADDLVKMLFNTEEVDLSQVKGPEAELPATTDAPGQGVEGKDEL